MSLSFCVLGSGSAGNSALVTLGDRRHLLIDAGLSPRRTVERLAPLGVGIDEITNVLVTHIDHDHLHQGWLEAEEPPCFTWHAHRRHLRRARLRGMTGWEPFEDGFELAPGTRVETTMLPHDQLGSCGFIIDHGGTRLGYATDVGRVTPTMLRRFTGLAALAIESNYDHALQVASGRPAVLKQRIMGGLGHLSNEQALDAVLGLDRIGRLRHVVLLHLSRQCNDPRLVRTLYARRAPHLLNRLTITSQDRSTPVLHVVPDGFARPPIGRQLDFLETMPGP